MILRTFSDIESIDYVIILMMIEVAALFFMLGLLFLYKSRDKSSKIKIYVIGVGLFLILYGVNRVIFFFNELLFDDFLWSITTGDFTAALEADSLKAFNYDIIWRISTGIGSGGLLVFLLVFESQILEKKTYFILSIIQGITLVVSLILGASADRMTLGRYILYIGLAPALAVPFCYFYLGVKANGVARRRAISAGLGFLIFYIGIAINSSAGKSVFLWLFSGITGLYFAYVMYAILINCGLLIYMRSIQF